MNTNVKLYKTKDGSNTLYHIKLKEIYHSRNGAITESLHVFIKYGLQYLMDKNYHNINIFEMGFGTGLNAILTYIYALANKKNIYYHSIDTLPLDWQTIQKLSYHSHPIITKSEHTYETMISAKWDALINISDNYKLFKENFNLENKVFSKHFDLIYYDAFAPNIQPQMWTENIFQKLHNALNTNGLLVTYCAKGDVRRALISAGFLVEKLPGPPGKREMLRATRTQ